MREEYRIDELNPRKNPYVSQAEEQVTISVDGSTVDYFQSMEASTGIPYQTLISLYLRDCAETCRQIPSCIFVSPLP